MSEENTNVNPENNQNNNQPVQQPAAPAKETSWWDITKMILKGTAGVAVLGLAAVGGYQIVKHFGGTVTEAAAEATETTSSLF